MSTFKRGLKDEFVAALNKEYAKEGWWSRFVGDKDIFIGIRDNYVDAYYRGCRLLHLEWRKEAIVGKINYKYLLRPDISKSKQDVKIVDGKANLLGDTKSWFLNDMSNIGKLKRAAKPYAGDEKKGVQNILNSNTNILDIEIAFGADESEAGPPRLDFVALQDLAEGVKIVFYEAKRFDNKELRAQSGTPDVVEQINSYSDKLKKNRKVIIESYRDVCRNRMRLTGIVKRLPEHHAGLIKDVADESRPLDIDESPVLIVFGFDEDQKKGDVWQTHKENLEKSLPGRVHFRGKAKDFKSVISGGA